MRRVPLPLQLGIALAAGSAAGAWLGPGAEPLGDLAQLLIKLLKTLATPLVFFAIVDAFCKIHIPARQGARLLFISLINACAAGGIALGIAQLIPVGRTVDLSALRAAIALPQAAADAGPAALKLDPVNLLKGFVPANILEPFTGNNVIAVVILSVLVGIAIRRLKDGESAAAEGARALENLFAGGFGVVSMILGWVVRVVPIAAFGIVAKAVGGSGFGIFRALGVFVAIVTLGLLVHVVIYYSILLAVVARKSPRLFFRQAADPLATAFATGSSLATLPVTLRTLQQTMKISPQSSRLAACVGTNLNHDGILLYEAVAALFVAQLHGIDLGLGQQALLVLTSTLAAVGIAGVPDAGLITLSLVLGSVGLPLVAVPLLLPVDWFIGRLRAMTNVTSDMVVATLLDRKDGSA